MGFISNMLGSLLYWIYEVVQNYGLALVLFTIITKILLLPLNIKQTESTKKMNAINPKMKALQEKYKNDKEKLNQKLMELYKEENYNPASGCLPLIIQMPIIIALFNVIREPLKYIFVNNPEAFEKALEKPFLWITNLSVMETQSTLLKVAGFAIPLMAILSGLTTYIQLKMTSPKGNKDQTTAMMSTIMPVFIAYISYKFPAGLVIYWVVGNIFTIIQQYFMLKVLPAKKEA